MGRRCIRLFVGSGGGSDGSRDNKCDGSKSGVDSARNHIYQLYRSFQSYIVLGDNTTLVYVKTEQKAAKGYEAVLSLIKDDDEMYDSIEQIYFQELRSVEEVTQLL